MDSGYDIVKNYPLPLEDIICSLTSAELDPGKAGVRNIEKKSDYIRRLCCSDAVISLASRYLSSRPKLVRAIYFNKTSTNNWLVSWHQDRTVAVSRKFTADDWGPWSVKDGVHHVQPSVEVLEKTITLRLHLDDANEENGCLMVMPCSHKQGLLAPSEIHAIVVSREPFMCCANAGDILVMKPHLLHASSKATEPTNRRVLHMEFSSFELPNGISWA